MATLYVFGEYMNRTDLQLLLAKKDQFKEIWLSKDSGEQLCALINGKIGLLMYLRSAEDSGFTSRNKEIVSNKMVEFVLNNGQADHYPESWTYPMSIVVRVMSEFLEGEGMSKVIEWHDESSS